MTREKLVKTVNLLLPVLGIAIIFFYAVCDTDCSYLKGTFLGVDLKALGILYMAALLALTIPFAQGYPQLVNHLRTMMLSGALGGEVILVRFQVINDIYCQFCLAFGLCILALFTVNFNQMQKHLALGAFLAGIAAFALFFTGSILPLYS